MSVSYLNTQGVNDVADLCQDPETKGFDLQAGQSWIYPTNYSVRDYQYNIIEKALHKNTLVSLPTGLGKTFIAAVVMYNFFRWYPHDKVIFMAPTRPLVKQQMDACYNIMAIPADVTAELTGSKVQQSRPEIWENKRVFFITPQVLQNDLAIIIELGAKIKCLVFDEAHRAKGNHAYCEVIRKLLPKNKLFRVLALSATPGSSSRDVIEVMRNLLIAHVEFRSEESDDVKPYVFERALETVVVPLGEKLQIIKDQYVQILEKYTRTLIQYKVIYGNCANLTKGKIFMVMKDFQAKNSGNRVPNYAEIMKTLNICVTLYHAYETLIRCGLRAFLNFYEEHINNPLLSGNISLRCILDDLREYLGPPAAVQPLPDGTYTPIPPTTKFGHPKFYKLRDILVAHFKNCESSTRVIVFFEYRESASEAYALLSQSYPMIKPRVFVGQGSGVTQRDQIHTVKAFREGTCNTLLSTCIGEEGLDVGEVDLIVCFDIANKSPIRMIQRMGRTGRKKEGRVVVLVTEGKEQQTLKDCLIYKSNLGNFITNSQQLEPGKYRDNPKMIPSYIQPKCQKMFITVKKQKQATKSKNLKDMLKGMSTEGPKFDDDLEIVEIRERIKTKIDNFWNKEHPLQCEVEESKLNFGKHLEKQRAFQTNGEIKHSKQTEIFVSLLQFADSKRYNLPVTQLSNFSNFGENKCLKQGDIRDMFSKPSANVLSQEILSSQFYNFEKEKDVTKSFPAELFDEISTFLSIIDMSTRNNCKTCEFLFECPKINNHQKSKKIDLSTWVQPDLSILDNITEHDLDVFIDSLKPKSKEFCQKDLLDTDNDIFSDVTFQNESSREIDQKSFSYEIPRSFDKILDSFKIREEKEEPVEMDKEKSFAYETPKSFGRILNLWGSSVCEETEKSETPRVPTNIHLDPIIENTEESELPIADHTDVLNFFKLSSIEEIFENVDLDETVVYTPDLIQSPNAKTPNLFEESPDLFASDEKHSTAVASEDPGSPILCTFDRSQQLKAKKKLFEQTKIEDTVKKPNLKNLHLKRQSFYESSRPRTSLKGNTVIDISDFCDLNSFGLSNKEATEIQKNGQVDDLDITDLCDLSGFGLPGPSKLKKDEDKAPIMMKSQVLKNNLQKKLSVDDLCDMSDFFGSQPIKNGKLENFSDDDKTNSGLEDSCDFYSPEKNNKSVVDLTESSQKNIMKQDSVTKTEIIDLTDSDFDSSPVKKMPTQVANKMQTQLSITQILGLVEATKVNSPKSDSQKENSLLSTPKTKKPQKSSLSLSTKKNILQMKQNRNSPKITTNNTPRKFDISLAGDSKDQSKKNILQLKKNANSPKRKTNNIPRKINISLPGDSDDEFEDPFKSPVFAKPKPIISASTHKSKTQKSPPVKPPKKKKKLFCEFIDEEAELSDDGKVVVSEDEDSGEDCFEASFVADETQDLLNNTSMHAKYLQSVKSPVRGKFKIPCRSTFNNANVFSQEVSNEDNTYVNDSFCINTEDMVESDETDISELELLEQKLKEMSKNKKRKKSDNSNRKRRRIVMPNDDSD